MTLVKPTAERLNSLHNFHLVRYPVLVITHERSSYVFYQEGCPESVLPDFGEKYPLLLTIPTSVNSVAYLGATKESSYHDIVCANRGNVWGKILYRSRLLRRAGVRIYTVDANSGWSDPTPGPGGYLDTWDLTPDRMQLNVIS